ncbi:MAG: YciI family protein [Verrucomicrobiota bacterium]
MEYLLLIYGEESKVPAREGPEHEKIFAEYIAFTAEVREKGIALGLNPLEPVSSTKTVRVRNGSAETTDGPFAETKEQLAGYYHLECKDLDEAIAYAARIPGARWGSIEIRPIRTLNPPTVGRGGDPAPSA